MRLRKNKWRRTRSHQRQSIMCRILHLGQSIDSVVILTVNTRPQKEHWSDRLKAMAAPTAMTTGPSIKIIHVTIHGALNMNGEIMIRGPRSIITTPKISKCCSLSFVILTLSVAIEGR